MGRKGTRSRNPKKRAKKKRRFGASDDRLPSGTEGLLAHRELEFLRDAGRAGSGKVPNHARKKLDERARKLAEARRIAERD
jgi:hypothetical protein